MQKLIVAMVFFVTFIFITACTNYDIEPQRINNISDNNKDNKTVNFFIDIIDNDKKEVITVESSESSSMQEKVGIIVDTMSQEAFNGLPINVTIYGNEMANVVLKESENSRFSWEKDYLNENNKERTINILVKNILQEQYKGPWIKTVQLYYEDELITLD